MPNGTLVLPLARCRWELDGRNLQRHASTVRRACIAIVAAGQPPPRQRSAASTRLRATHDRQRARCSQGQTCRPECTNRLARALAAAGKSSLAASPTLCPFLHGPQPVRLHSPSLATFSYLLPQLLISLLSSLKLF
jgi:hypothetical protein